MDYVGSMGVKDVFRPLESAYEILPFTFNCLSPRLS